MSAGRLDPGEGAVSSGVVVGVPGDEESSVSVGVGFGFFCVVGVGIAKSCCIEVGAGIFVTVSPAMKFQKYPPAMRLIRQRQRQPMRITTAIAIKRRRFEDSMIYSRGLESIARMRVNTQPS